MFENEQLACISKFCYEFSHDRMDGIDVISVKDKYSRNEAYKIQKPCVEAKDDNSTVRSFPVNNMA